MLVPRRMTPGVLLLLLLTACQPWTRVPMPEPMCLPRTDRVELWVGGRPVVLREVIIEADTIRGRTIPALRRPDSAVVVPRSSVDSLRLVLPDNNNWLGLGFLGGFAAGVAVITAVFRAASGT
jgi:hypothetical protein